MTVIADRHASTATSAEPATILVAEDDQAMRRLIEVVLQRQGYRTVAAESGEQTLSCARGELPELVLLDIQLPDMEGFEVCRRLRQDPRFDSVPIIFLTALEDTQAKVRGFQLGGNDFVVKPAEPLELVTRIQAHLDAARSFKVVSRQASLLGTIVSSQEGRLGQVRQGQQSLLADMSEFPELQLGVRFRPTLEAGGDFYDILRFSDDEFGLLVADVSGHDLSVAYLTGALKAMSVSFTSSALSVEETMMMLNAALRKFLQQDRYVTACYAKFTRSTMTLEVGVAGHPAPFFIGRGGSGDYLDLAGDVLGMHEIMECTVQTRQVEPGDRLFLFTDGMLENYCPPAGQRKGILYGLRALSASLTARRGQPIRAAVDEVVDDLLNQNQGEVDDDLILMGIEFTP